MGEIVGDTATGTTATPLYWASATSAPTALDTGGLSNVEYATGINNAGDIVGSDEGPFAGLLWASPTSVPTVLPDTPMNAGFLARAINGKGEIVGADYLEGPLYWATPSSAPHVLPNGGWTGVSPTGINDRGQIVGSATPQSGVGFVALYWPPSCR